MSVLVVIPCLNEEAHLPGLLARLCADPRAARIVVVDGGSSDRSVEIVRQAAIADARVISMHNPERIQSAGINLAVKAHGAEAPLFVRVDAHAAYPDEFLGRLIAAQAETGADSVTVSMHAVATPGACFQRAAATAQNSKLGAGGSPHREGGGRIWVDHGHHALFRTESFMSVGGYDESFSHNEDAELDLRLKARGAKILLAADIRIDYVPRATPGALARQYFNFGAGRARTALKHKTPLKLRQLAPAAIAPAVALALLAPLWPWSAAPAAIWLTLCLAYGLVLGVRARSGCACAAGIAAAIMHAAWSVGFLRGLIGASGTPVHSPASA
jgi:succinoglycan biosynthesis protein ExoA